MFVQYSHRLMRKGVLLLTGLMLLLGSGCSGGSNQGDSAADKHTTGGSEQASKADLDAALKKSFQRAMRPGWWLRCRPPNTRGLAPLGSRTALPVSR